MEATIKKIRSKYNVDRKITIKHYTKEIKKEINKKVGNEVIWEAPIYSLNVSLIINRKVTNFKSNISYNGRNQLGDKVFNHLYSDAIEREKELLHDIVIKLNPFDSDSFDIKEVYKYFSSDNWYLHNGINKLLFFELLGTNDSLKIPMVHYVNPNSFFQISTNKEIKERGAKFKSKIWFIDVIIWSLAQDNVCGFLVNSPTIFDLVNGRFQKALFSDNFCMISKTEKVELISEIEFLLEKYRDYIF
jgi:hypothetical protein